MISLFIDGNQQTRIVGKLGQGYIVKSGWVVKKILKRYGPLTLPCVVPLLTSLHSQTIPLHNTAASGRIENLNTSSLLDEGSKDSSLIFPLIDGA